MILEKKKLNLVIFVVLLLLVAQTAVLPIRAVQAQQDINAEELWLDLSMGPPLIPLFNAAARNDDIARIEHPSQIDQLRGIENGRKMVIFKSIEQTEAFLPDMAGEIDIIGYNLEHSPATPADEQQDPVDSIKRMRELADEHDVLLAFGPDHDFALSHGVQIAPYVDIFVLQIQRQQTNPGTVKAFVEPLVPLLHEANPALEVSVQVRTEGDVQAIVDLVESLDADLAGISILTSPETVDVAEELVLSLRPEAELPSEGFGQFSTGILLAVGGAILLVAVIIFRLMRQSGEDETA